MSGPLRQSTSKAILIGPFLDTAGDPVTSLTIANTDIKLSKDGAASVNKNSGGATHDVNGMYLLTLNATDTNTVGKLKGSVNVAGAMPVTFDRDVKEEAVFDRLDAAGATGYSTHSAADVWAVGARTITGGDVATVAGRASPANWNALGINGSGHVSRVTLCDTVTANTDMRGTDNASTHSAADVWAVATRTVTGGTINTLAAGAVSAASLASDACTKVADFVLRRGYGAARASSDGDTVSFRSLLGAVAKLVNRVDAQSDPLTIYHEDDTTAAGTQTLTTDSNADPITSVDTN